MSQNPFKCIEPHRFGDLITCFTAFINSIRSLCASDTYGAVLAVSLGLCGDTSGQLGMQRDGESECVYTLAAGTCEEDWGLVLPGSLNPPNHSQTRGSVCGMRIYGGGEPSATDLGPGLGGHGSWARQRDPQTSRLSGTPRMLSGGRD